MPLTALVSRVRQRLGHRVRGPAGSASKHTRVGFSIHRVPAASTNSTSTPVSEPSGSEKAAKGTDGSGTSPWLPWASGTVRSPAAARTPSAGVTIRVASRATAAEPPTT